MEADAAPTLVPLLALGSPGILYAVRNDKSQSHTWFIAVALFVIPIACAMGEEYWRFLFGLAVAAFLIVVQLPGQAQGLGKGLGKLVQGFGLMVGAFCKVIYESLRAIAPHVGRALSQLSAKLFAGLKQLFNMLSQRRP